MGALAKIVPKPKGAYNALATYNTLDIVRYGTKVFMCRQDNITNVTPVDGLVWMFLVEDGDGSGVDTFAELNDVSLSDLADGQVPVYNATDEVWENGTPATGVDSFSELDDVQLTGLTDGQIPIYDATAQKWKNGAIPAPTIPGFQFVGKDDTSYPLTFTYAWQIPSGSGWTTVELSAEIAAADVDKYSKIVPLALQADGISFFFADILSYAITRTGDHYYVRMVVKHQGAYSATTVAKGYLLGLVLSAS